MDGLIYKLPEVDSFCCGCELRTGAKFVAWLKVVSGILIELAAAVIMAALDEARSEIKPGLFHDLGVARIIFFMAVTGVVMLYCLFELVMGFVLLIGINKSDNKMVKFWLNAEIILFILQVVSIILIGQFMSTLIAADRQPGPVFLMLFSAAINWAISFYWIVVVRSYLLCQTRGSLPTSTHQRVPVISSIPMQHI